MNRKLLAFAVFFLGLIWVFSPHIAQCEDQQPIDIGDVQVNGIDVVGTTAYVANDDGLVIFDINSPTVQTVIPVTGSAVDGAVVGAKNVVVSGSYAYVTSNEDKLVVFAIDPSSTSQTSDGFQDPADSSDTSQSDDSSQKTESASFDLKKSVLTIGVVQVVDGPTYYDVEMKQRGASSNFELISFTSEPPNGTVSDEDEQTESVSTE